MGADGRFWLGADVQRCPLGLPLSPRKPTFKPQRPLYPKAVLVVDPKHQKPPTKELMELRGLAADGKLSNRINMALRKQKNPVAVKYN